MFKRIIIQIIDLDELKFLSLDEEKVFESVWNFFYESLEFFKLFEKILIYGKIKSGFFRDLYY